MLLIPTDLTSAFHTSRADSLILTQHVLATIWTHIHMHIYHHHHHHHHIVLAARISLTLSRHSSLSFIALGRSSGQQPVSSHSC